MSDDSRVDRLSVPKGIELKIETRVSYIDRRRGIDVPLGHYDRDGWRSYEFVEGDVGSLGLEPHELVSWLEGRNWFGEPFMEDDLAADAVEQTLRRCIALSEAAGKQVEECV